MKEMKEWKNNVVRRVSRASCVEWGDARESVFMVCGRHPRRVLKLRSRKTDAVRKLTSRKPFHPDTVWHCSNGACFRRDATQQALAVPFAREGITSAISCDGRSSQS